MNLSRINAVLILASALALDVNAAEQPVKRSPLEGIWLWNFNMPDGSHVTPRVKFRTKDGELVGTSRFRQGSEAPVTNIVLKDGQVSFDVVRDYLGEPVVTHYKGKLSGTAIKGKITSVANGEEQTYDWDAKRVSGIDGVWKWTVTFGEWTFDSRVTLKADGEKLTGKLAGGRGGDLDIHKGRFRDNRVYFEVERRSREGEKSTNVYRGKLDGDRIIGSYTSTFREHRTNEWDAVRAD
jgi:hypothetical protein